jgi:hypothetical protein
VDNSLQEIAGSFTFLAMKNKWLATLALALLPTAMVVPQSLANTPNCIGSDCEVTFVYTGEYQTWSLPPGAVNVRFELYGAAGGRGGAGGKVSGAFIDVPQTLQIYIGGAGAMGTGVSGGFNGGGSSGGNSATEGSGGGASDIRLSESLQSRIVVAGGGGGGGGEAGGNGGHGGEVFAAHGGSGQASGGGGASPSAGGFAGVSNGGYQQATVGQFGQGGAGGFSTFAGGGGGGGGWYGGGGGGADDNTCCSDGGGGGGGASYANTEYVADVSHEVGVSWGHGWLTLRYSLVPVISYFDLIQTSGERAVYTIEASEDIVGLDESDLVVSGEGCELASLTVDGTLAYGAVTGCQSGEVTLTVLTGSFGYQQQGPPTDTSAFMTFDATPPAFAFTSDVSVTSSSDQVIEFEVSDQLALEPDMFDLVGCSQLEVLTSELSLTDCAEGAVSVALKAGVLTDIWQNVGPSEPVTFSFEVDQTAPVATWSEIAITGSGPFSYSASLDFSEPVSISNLALAFASTAECEAVSETLPMQLRVNASCDYSSVQWTFAGQVRDAAGNLMADRNLSVQAENPAPVAPIAVPAPVFVPVPVPVIVAPEPIQEVPTTQSPTTTESPAASESEQVFTESASVIVEPQEPEVVAVTSRTPRSAPEPSALANEEVSSAEETLDVAAEPTQSVEPQPILVEEQIGEAPLAQPVLNEAIPEEQPGFPWWPVALLVAIGALGVGAWRLSGR